MGSPTTGEADPASAGLVDAEALGIFLTPLWDRSGREKQVCEKGPSDRREIQTLGEIRSQ